MTNTIVSSIASKQQQLVVNAANKSKFVADTASQYAIKAQSIKEESGSLTKSVDGLLSQARSKLGEAHKHNKSLSTMIALLKQTNNNNFSKLQDEVTSALSYAHKAIVSVRYDLEESESEEVAKQLVRALHSAINEATKELHQADQQIQHRAASIYQSGDNPTQRIRSMLKRASILITDSQLLHDMALETMNSLPKSSNNRSLKQSLRGAHQEVNEISQLFMTLKKGFKHIVRENRK